MSRPANLHSATARADHDTREVEASGKRGRSSKVTRDMILEAALHEFAEQGYDAATTASIARRVGVTQPLIHYHFRSKEALWRTTVDQLFRRLFESLAKADAETETLAPTTRIVARAYNFLAFLADTPQFSRLMNNECAVRTARLQWLVETHLRPLFKQWNTYVDEGKKGGMIKDIPNVFIMFSFLGAAFHFYDAAALASEMYGVDPFDPEVTRSYGDALIEMFLVGALKPEAVPARRD
jgi:TetR/AcrR family transcriptional regulator